MEVISYDLKLDVDFRKAFVKGSEAIEVRGAKAPLSLDCSTLKVGSVKLNGKPARFRLDEKRGKLVISGAPGPRSMVEVEYTKQVSDDVIFGLYKSKYGKDYILATDLEPAEAHTVFPCFDEPAYKAVFRLELTYDSDLKVVANTHALRSGSAGPGRTKMKFAETPRMSTYLFFFAVGHFEGLTTRAGGIWIATATRPGQAKNSVLAMKIIGEAVAEYQKYFGVRYPLKKLHLVALPEYHTGAMENWGAIASRESYALITEETSFSQKNRGAMSMVHEVAHQWFGNLVTMKWWDDLWLNESFATFMSYKMTDRLRPAWEMWNEFLRDETFRALDQDALSTTHPVQAHVKTVGEAMHLFDAISYNKGASVLRMLEAYLGEETFRKGVSDYLKKFSYSNASGKDLWKALGKASKLPVESLAREWLTRPGYPVIEASEEKGKVVLTQRPFKLKGGKSAGVWPVPVQLRIDGKDASLFLRGKTAAVRATPKRELLANVGRAGFYTVRYDEAGYDRLARSFSKLDPRDRAGIMNDLYLFLQAGEVDPEIYLRFVALCAESPDSITTQTVTDQLNLLVAIAGDSKALRKMYPKFYPVLLEKLGEKKPGEPEYIGATREAVSAQYVDLDMDYARRLAPQFERYSEVDPNLRQAVAMAYAIVNGEAARDRLTSMAKTLQGEVDRAKIYAGLSAFRDPTLVKDSLDLGISGEVSRSDSLYPLIYSSYNPGAREVVWDWLTSKYDRLLELYVGSQQFYLYMGVVFPVIGATNEGRTRRFLSGKRLKSGGSTYTRTLERVGINARIRKLFLEA